jgi:hypothetical protein
VMPHRRRKSEGLRAWKEEYNRSHLQVRARVEHVFTRMKTWKILRDCSLRATEYTTPCSATHACTTSPSPNRGAELIAAGRTHRPQDQLRDKPRATREEQQAGRCMAPRGRPCWDRPDLLLGTTALDGAVRTAQKPRPEQHGPRSEQRSVPRRGEDRHPRCDQCRCPLVISLYSCAVGLVICVPSP